METLGSSHSLSITGSCPSHPELGHHHVRSQPTRSPVWISPREQHSQYDFLSETGPREMHRAEPKLVHCIHWPDQGLWYSQQRGPLVYTCMVWLPPEVHPDHQALPCWYDRTSPLKWWSVWSFQDLQWGEARLCPGTSPLQLFLHFCPQLHWTGSCWGSVYLPPLWWFHIQPSQTHSQVKDSDLIQAALFADVCALMAHKSSDLQTMLNRFSDTSKLSALTISLGKIWGSFPAKCPNSSAPQPTITFDGMELKTVESFKYLGSMWSQVMDNLTRKMSMRISKAQPSSWKTAAIGCSHTTMCPWPQSWKSTELLSSHHCSMSESHGLSTVITSGSWRSSICEHTIPSWVSDSRTINLHWSNAVESPALLGWPHHQDGWWVHTKALVLWWTSTRTKKTRWAMKVLQGHTEEQPEIM